MPSHSQHHPIRQRARPLEVVSDDLITKVAGWRRQRMSWAAIARNLGVCERDARRRFDPPSAATNPVRPGPAVCPLKPGDHP